MLLRPYRSRHKISVAVISGTGDYIGACRELRIEKLADHQFTIMFEPA
jgi:hypothetical protein